MLMLVPDALLKLILLVVKSVPLAVSNANHPVDKYTVLMLAPLAFIYSTLLAESELILPTSICDVLAYMFCEYTS